MGADRLPVFLDLAREWRAVADALQSRGVPEGDQALAVCREAAWCHLMFVGGNHRAALVRLWVMIGAPPGAFPVPIDEATAFAVAADLFERLRAAVSERHPAAFVLATAA